MTEDEIVGWHEIIPLICTSSVWGQYPVFSHPEFPQAHHWGRSPLVWTGPTLLLTANGMWQREWSVPSETRL